MSNITSINATFALSIAGVYDIPQVLQGWSTDDAFATESVTLVETMMGIDGNLAAGKVNASRLITVTTMANSPSNALFDNWSAAMDALNDVIWANGIITIPAMSRVFALRKGVLKTYAPLSDVRKVLQPRKFGLEFERIIGSPTP